MKILGELPSLVVALESDFKGHCLKCKGRRGIRNEVYKPYRDKQVLEKGKCIQCGSVMRSFRKAVFYSKNSYRGTDQRLASKIDYPKMEFIDLNKLLGKEMARRINRNTKYHPLKSVNLAVKSLDMSPRDVAQLIIRARSRRPVKVNT
mgnify:FL=1|tara:strand:+ start:204 stop:647 length:444 start_codon:yes stop_codon:yes gene_type:complete